MRASAVGEQVYLWWRKNSGWAKANIYKGVDKTSGEDCLFLEFLVKNFEESGITDSQQGWEDEGSRFNYERAAHRMECGNITDFISQPSIIYPHRKFGSESKRYIWQGLTEENQALLKKWLWEVNHGVERVANVYKGINTSGKYFFMELHLRNFDKSGIPDFHEGWRDFGYKTEEIDTGTALSHKNVCWIKSEPSFVHKDRKFGQTIEGYTWSQVTEKEAKQISRVL